MKILHVIDQLNAGGAERVCVDLANISFARGLSVGILVLLDESKLDSAVAPGIALYYLKRKSKFSIRKYLEIATICDQYDVIHVHMRHVYRYMVLVKLLGRVKRRMILHDHFGAIHTQKNVPALFKSLFKPQFFVGVSKELTDWAVHRLRMDKATVFLLSNIIRQRAPIHQIPARDLVIISNIRRTKNIRLAIDVATEAGMKLDIIGQIVDIAYYNELKDYIRIQNAEARIRFIHDCYDVQSKLGNYKMAIHTASSETGPLVLMEYLAQGLNFLSYQTGEVAEILQPLFPQFFVETFDVNDWKLKVNHILSRPTDKAQLLDVFQKNFSEDTYFEKCKEIYQKVLSS